MGLTEPALKEGFVVELRTEPRQAGKLYTVLGIEPMVYRTGTGADTEFSEVAFGSATDWVELSLIEPKDNPQHLLEAWIGSDDGGRWRYKFPAGTDRLGPDADLDAGFFTNEESPAFAPTLRLWLIKDKIPQFAYSNTVCPMSVTPALTIKGWKYDIIPYEGTPPAKTILTIGGVHLG